jgi:hypothetical protein
MPAAGAEVNRGLEHNEIHWSSVLLGLTDIIFRNSHFAPLKREIFSWPQSQTRHLGICFCADHFLALECTGSDVIQVIT